MSNFQPGWYEVDTYEWLKVTHDRWVCPPWSSACYWKWGDRDQTINMEYYLHENEYKSILKHEYGHHVHLSQMNDEDRTVWDRARDVEYMTPKLEKYGINMKAQYVSAYASTNAKEDFAESYKKWYDGTFDNYNDLKTLLSTYYYNKYN